MTSTLLDSRHVTPPELLVAVLSRGRVLRGIDPAIWSAMLEEARRQDVLALLYARLRELPQGTVPPQLLAGLRERYTIIALHSAVIFRELGLIADALHSREIPMLVLKGVHLAAGVYRERAYRSMGDIDVMVPVDRLADAAAALREAGFQVPFDGTFDVAAYMQQSNHLPRMGAPNGRGIGVEVHANIELPDSPFDIRPAELWSEARTLEIDGRSVHVLSPEQLLLHLCVHTCYHHRFDHAPLKQLCDIAAVLEHYGDEMNWESVVGTAERWRVQPYVRFTLLLAQRLFNAPVPELISTALPADPGEERLLGNARAYILDRTLAVPVALTSVVRARSPWRKLRNALKRLFPPRDRLAAMYGLPRGARHVPLWYFYRPFDLLARNGGRTLRLMLPGAGRQRLREREHNRMLLKDALRQWAQNSTTPSQQ